MKNKKNDWVVNDKDIESRSIVLKPSNLHKIDPNKIQSVQDMFEILKRIPMYVDDEGVKGIEHLIEDEEIVKLVCRDCGTSIEGKRNFLEGKSCIHCIKHNTEIVPIDKECKS